MSSFRIDRQYVSFISAETHSVFQPGQLAGAKALFADVPSACRTEQGGETDRRCAAILEQAERDAREKARIILENARSQADAAMAQAKQEADELLDGARARAAAVLDEAKQAGYAEGMRRARSDAEQAKAAAERELLRLEETLRSEYSGLVDGLRAEVISLVMDIVRKVINTKLCESDDVFLGLVNAALEQLKHSGTVLIHVCPEDYARYFGARPAAECVGGGKSDLLVVEEAEYMPGDLVLETEGELLDYSVSRQLDRLEHAFSQEGNGAVQWE